MIYFLLSQTNTFYLVSLFIRLRQNTLQLAAGMNGVVNRVEARQSEDGSILSTCYDFGLATAQFRFDTPQLAAGSFIPLDDLMKAHTLILYNSSHEPIQNVRFGNNALGDFFAIMPKTVDAGS